MRDDWARELDLTRSEYTVQQTAAYYGSRLGALKARIAEPDYKRSVRDLVLLDSAVAFLDRVARDDLDIFANQSGDPS